MHRVRDLVGEDGGALALGFWKIWSDPKVAARDRLTAGQWLADRGFGKSVETTVTLDASTAAALGGLDDAEIVVFAREWLGKRAKVIDAKPAPQLPSDQAVPGPVQAPLLADAPEGAHK
jgi:hypothetical protein